MSLKILVAPARRGKTDWAVSKTLKRCANLTGSPFVVVPSELKGDDFKKRLAARGGAMGVQVGTFRELSRTILDKNKSYPNKSKESISWCIHSQVELGSEGKTGRSLEKLWHLKEG